MTQENLKTTSNPVIRQLSEHTINRIAAGEVIERPAAVVKELLENALDAGADRIRVCLNNGGIDRIEVTDNGCGMTPDNLRLAIERHCTSKLPKDDLVHIATLGFRGEALPSIGAAARLEITSRVMDGDQAWQINVEGGKHSDVHPAAGLTGTRVLVEDLFFATPARRKFLKSAKVEVKRCETVVQRLAIARAGVAFYLQIDDKVIFDLPSQSQMDRIQAIFPDIHSEELISVNYNREELGLTGFISAPSVNRATAAHQIMIVNQRPVVDPVIQTAIRVAYRSVLEKGRYPVVVLFLTVPLDKVDINVHPAKTELRYADENAVRALIIGSLQKSLSLVACVAGVHQESLDVTPRQYIPKTASIIRPPAKNNHVNLAFMMENYYGENREGTVPQPLVLQETSQPVEAPVISQTPSQISDFPLGKAIAQIFKTYILAITANQELVMVDQHAAHERLTHELLREQYLGNGIQVQALLLPEIIELLPREAKCLLDFKDSLANFGIEIESFGGNAILVRAIPQLLGTASIQPLLKDLAEELESDEQTNPTESETLNGRLDAIIARMACHHSVRAGRSLNSDEMNALLRQMEKTPRAGTCSHGRPTWLKWSKEDIEKLFHRS